MMCHVSSPWDYADYQFQKRKSIQQPKLTKHRLYTLISHVSGCICLSSLVSLVDNHKFILSILFMALPVQAVNTDDSSSGPKCSVFEGVNAAYIAWFIAFTYVHCMGSLETTRAISPYPWDINVPRASRSGRPDCARAHCQTEMG